MEGNQFDSLRMPDKGDPLSDSVHSAAWMKALVQAAIGRSTTGGAQKNADQFLELEHYSGTLPALSVVGAIGATYPVSPASEPYRPYMKAHLGRSQLTLYTREDYTSANTRLIAYPFMANSPVRVKVAATGADTYVTGMPIGRLPGQISIKAGGGGLLLASLPYTPDSGANYYCWVLPDLENRWKVRYKQPIPVATNAETSPSTGLAYVDLLLSTGNLTTSLLEVTVTNRSTTTSFSEDEFGEIAWMQGEWRPVSAAASGSQRIWFTIISVECVSATEVILTVEPTYYTGGCTTTIPGEDAYGYVTVEDVCGTLLYYTAAWLVGKTGSATYMYPRIGVCTPKWLVDSICGSPECA